MPLNRGPARFARRCSIGLLGKSKSRNEMRNKLRNKLWNEVRNKLRNKSRKRNAKTNCETNHETKCEKKCETNYETKCKTNCETNQESETNFTLRNKSRKRNAKQFAKRISNCEKLSRKIFRKFLSQSSIPFRRHRQRDVDRPLPQNACHFVQQMPHALSNATLRFPRSIWHASRKTSLTK